MQLYTWIYSLKQTLSSDTEASLQRAISAFLSQWKSHGTPVEGMIQLKYQRFVIVQANPEDERPSGCSMDSLKRAVSSILEEHHLEQVDAGYVFFRNANGEIEHVFHRDLQSHIAQGKLQAETIVFDHTLSQSDDLTVWEVPLSSTWLKRYLKDQRLST